VNACTSVIMAGSCDIGIPVQFTGTIAVCSAGPGPCGDGVRRRTLRRANVSHSKRHQSLARNRGDSSGTKTWQRPTALSIFCSQRSPPSSWASRNPGAWPVGSTSSSLTVSDTSSKNRLTKLRSLAEPKARAPE
jgi:hypothetical protein